MDNLELHKKFLDPALKKRLACLKSATKAREITRNRIEQNLLSKEFRQVEIDEFQKPIVKKLEEESNKYAISNIYDEITNMKDAIANISFASPTAIPNEYVARAIEEVATPTEEVARPKGKRYDPTKETDESFIESLGLKTPSSFMSGKLDKNEIDENISKSIIILKRIGTKMSHISRKKGVNNKEYNKYEKERDYLREYKKALNGYKRGIEKGTLQEGEGCSNNNKKCKRLQVLIASRSAGNTSKEVYNEIVNILNDLFDKEIIDKKYIDKMYKLYL